MQFQPDQSLMAEIILWITSVVLNYTKKGFVHAQDIFTVKYYKVAPAFRKTSCSIIYLKYIFLHICIYMLLCN